MDFFRGYRLIYTLIIIIAVIWIFTSYLPKSKANEFFRDLEERPGIEGMADKRLLTKMNFG